MRYHLVLRSEKTYWWDEDGIGSCMFNAENDEQARSFASTIVMRINRKYWRMREPRNVFICSLSRVKENGYGNILEPVSLWNCVKPLNGFTEIRKALNAFYPKVNGKKRKTSMMPMFSQYNPISLHS